MMPIPSWLSISPDSFLQAAEAGARTGVSVASLRQQAQEASGKLGLGYAELGQRGAESAAAQSEAQAKLAEAQRQDMADRLFKQTQMQQQQNESDRDYALRLQGLGIDKGKLDLATQGLALDTQKANQPHVFGMTGGGVTTYDPTTGKTQIVPNPNHVTPTPTLPLADSLELRNQYSILNRANQNKDQAGADAARAAIQRITGQTNSLDLPSPQATPSDAPLDPTQLYHPAPGAYDPSQFLPLPGVGSQPATSNAPQVGNVEGGYKFLGGDPTDQQNWEPAQ